MSDNANKLQTQYVPYTIIKMPDNDDPFIPWQQSAAQKRAAVNALIPHAWRVSRVPSAEEQPNVTGDYTRQFLSLGEISITETEATDILAKTTSGVWKAKEITLAFCHRAAIGHQLVCRTEIDSDEAMRGLTCNRLPVFTSSSLMQQLPKLNY